MPKTQRRAFTLIELLVVIGVLAILLTIVLIAINPARQFSQSNDTKRRSDVNAVLNAIHQFAADNRGTLPAGMANVAATPMPLRQSATPDPLTEADICADVVTDYIAAMPVDPLTNNGTPVTDCTAAYDTGYTVSRSATNNRITVYAPDGELDTAISVTR
jgi:type IV pilus assembly protein PilA